MNLFVHQQNEKYYVVDVEGNCYSHGKNKEQAISNALSKGIQIEDIDI